jgi:hypothetical protein
MPDDELGKHLDDMPKYERLFDGSSGDDDPIETRVNTIMDAVQETRRQILKPKRYWLPNLRRRLPSS